MSQRQMRLGEHLPPDSPLDHAPPPDHLCHCGRVLVTGSRFDHGKWRTTADCPKHGTRRVIYDLHPLTRQRLPHGHA